VWNVLKFDVVVLVEVQVRGHWVVH